MTLLLERTGPLCLVEDLGRRGHARSGVGEGGAMDRAALRLANRVVGNAEDEPGLEVLAGGLVATADRACVVAVTGAVAAMSVDGRPVDQGRALVLQPGQRLSVGRAEVGLRCYLALRGGVVSRRSLGSASSNPLLGLGAPPLVPGDRVVAGDRVGTLPVADLTHVHVPGIEVTVRAMVGPREDWVEPGALTVLSSTTWRPSPDSDRIGIRLTGGTLRWRQRRELPSELVVRGSVQVPPSGEPLVFMADHPTTGGYPVVAVVLDEDTDLLGQAGPETRVRFDLARSTW